VVDELINIELKSNEILMKHGYYVSDIVDVNNYMYRDNQKIIKSSSTNINKLLSEIFGSTNIPIIGKRRINRIAKNINMDNLNNQLEIIGGKLYQKIINDNNIYRSYINGYYWINNNMLETVHRNLGYYNPLQTDLSNNIKSQIIDWIINSNNQKILIRDIKESIPNLIKIIDDNKFIGDIKRYLTKNNEILYIYIIDLYIIYKINKITIIIYDNYENIVGLFDNGFKYLQSYYENDNLNNYKKFKEYINIKFEVNKFSITNNPRSLTTIYYLK
jgi:hypothetical protein